MYSAFLRSIEANKYRTTTEEISKKYRTNDGNGITVSYSENTLQF